MKRYFKEMRLQLCSLISINLKPKYISINLHVHMPLYLSDPDKNFSSFDHLVSTPSLSQNTVVRFYRCSTLPVCNG